MTPGPFTDPEGESALVRVLVRMDDLIPWHRPSCPAFGEAEECECDFWERVGA